MNKLAFLYSILLIYEVTATKSIAGSDGNVSEIRQNFAPLCEQAIEDQVQKELEASYFYLQYANFFQQYDVALIGFHEMFEHSSIEEREHAQLLIDYVYKRGGKVNLKTIGSPSDSPMVNTTIKIVAAALEKEKEVNAAILQLFNCSGVDPHFQDFLAASLISEQVESIHDLGILLTRLRRCAVAAHTLPICEHAIDRELLEEYSKKKA